MNNENIVATVGSINITEAELEAFIKTLPQEQQMYAQNPQFRQQCIDQLVAMNLFSMLGEEEKLDETEEFERIIANARREILAQLAMKKLFAAVEVTEEDCKAFYEQNPQFFQHCSGEVNIFLGVPGLIFHDNGFCRYTAFHRYFGKPNRFRFRKHTFRIAAQSAGEEDLGCVALQIQFCRPDGNVRIEIAETYDHVRLRRLLVHAKIVPDHFQWF